MQLQSVAYIPIHTYIYMRASGWLINYCYTRGEGVCCSRDTHQREWWKKGVCRNYFIGRVSPMECLEFFDHWNTPPAPHHHVTMAIDTSCTRERTHIFRLGRESLVSPFYLPQCNCVRVHTISTHSGYSQLVKFLFSYILLVVFFSFFLSPSINILYFFFTFYIATSALLLYYYFTNCARSVDVTRLFPAGIPMTFFPSLIYSRAITGACLLVLHKILGSRTTFPGRGNCANDLPDPDSLILTHTYIIISRKAIYRSLIWELDQFHRRVICPVPRGKVSQRAIRDFHRVPH